MVYKTFTLLKKLQQVKITATNNQGANGIWYWFILNKIKFDYNRKDHSLSIDWQTIALLAGTEVEAEVIKTTTSASTFIVLTNL